jgi:hypothetical protein
MTMNDGSADPSPTMAEVKDLALDAVERLNKVEKDARLEIADLRSKVLTKEHFKKRSHEMIRIAIITGLVLSLLGIVVEHAAITKCFLSSAQVGWSEKTCSAMFPGYEKARNQSVKNLAGLQSVIAQVPADKARIDELQNEVNQLKAKAGP